MKKIVRMSTNKAGVQPGKPTRLHKNAYKKKK